MPSFCRISIRISVGRLSSSEGVFEFDFEFDDVLLDAVALSFRLDCTGSKI